MLNIYIYKTLEDLDHIHILDFYLGQKDFGVHRPGDETIKLLNKKFFNLVDLPEQSDYFLLPHDYFKIKDKNYLRDFINLSNKYKKKILAIAYGDSSEFIDIPNSIVFRTSQYKYRLQNNEVIMPALADDLLFTNFLSFLDKKQKPVVGFCGWASFDTSWSFIKQYIRSLSIFNRPVLKKGIFFRIKLLNILGKSELLSTNFIIRKTYSGNEKTRKGTFEDLRLEYIENILKSDLSLSIKGDGNFSIRFYEILSLGRVPIFIDTDSVLPLENTIDYKSFILKVDYRNIKNIDVIASDFYKNLSEEDFVSMQKKSREVFESYLRLDSFFQHVLTEGFLNRFDSRVV